MAANAAACWVPSIAALRFGATTTPTRTLTRTVTASASKGMDEARRYSVAPMMDVTDRHFRALARLITRRATLWTEMVVDRTLIHNEEARTRELLMPPVEPRGADNLTVLQLGGSEPAELAAACRLAADAGYREVNLNCGCPSPRVAGKGCFGAALMKQPEDVARMLAAMRGALPAHVALSVKHRLGVDKEAEYEHTARFVDVVSKGADVTHFVVHARAAWLNGINPKQNREIPPLRYDNVRRLAADFPHLRFTINGGIKTTQHAVELLSDGVLEGAMVGRAARDAPWAALADVDALVYNDRTYAVTRREVLRRYVEYAEDVHIEQGCPRRVLIKPVLNLFHGEQRGKMFRREVDEQLRDNGNTMEDIVMGAASVLSDDIVDALPPSLLCQRVGDGEENGSRRRVETMRRGVLMDVGVNR